MEKLERSQFFTNRISKIIEKIVSGAPANAINSYENKIVQLGPVIREINNELDEPLAVFLNKISKHGLTGEEALEILLDSRKFNLFDTTVSIMNSIIAENLSVSADSFYEILDISRSLDLSWSINLNTEQNTFINDDLRETKRTKLNLPTDFR